jgi:predicted Rossmann-fold nucleotide-binding protein
MLERAIHEKFIKKEHANLWAFANTPAEVFPAILEMGDDRIVQKSRAKL